MYYFPGFGLPVLATHSHRTVIARVCTTQPCYDPMVLVHARALLGEATTYVHADYHDPERILAEAATTLDFGEPVAVMFMGVLGYEPDLGVVRSIVERTMAATPPGSHLVLWDGTDTTPAVVEGARKLAESGGAPYLLRSPAQLASCFEGLTMVEPGLVQITRWRTDDADAERIDAYGAVARKA